MKVLLCGEGPHDIGVIEHWSIDSKKIEVSEGWLQALLGRILPDDLEFLLVPRSRLVSLPGRDKPPYPKGHGRKAMLAKFRAVADDCDLVVFMVDADTPNSKEWSVKVEEIRDGFAKVETDRPVALACVPMSTSESWMLSDCAPWKTLGLKDAETRLPKNPESIWGKKSEPQSNHPHCLFARLCAEANTTDSRETRHFLMSNADLQAIKQKCPDSFGPFVDAVASA